MALLAALMFRLRVALVITVFVIIAGTVKSTVKKLQPTSAQSSVLVEQSAKVRAEPVNEKQEPEKAEESPASDVANSKPGDSGP
jgi:hypothetical protein